jgi:hypothetical protein
MLAGFNPRLTLSMLGGNAENMLGFQGFRGRMDEVRLWRTARSEAQIRENLLTRLTGQEEGLLALWNFDDEANPGRDASPSRHDGALQGGAQVVPDFGGDTSPAQSVSRTSTVTITGRITDAAGKPLPGADVQLLQGARKIASAKAGPDGNCFLITTANEKPYRLLASSGHLEAISAQVQLKPGANTIDLELRDTLRISGILAGQDKQPRRGVKL